LGGIAILRNNDNAYPLVILWAIFGIMVKFPEQKDIMLGVAIGVITIIISFALRYKFITK